jgi:hypothetical protein
MGKQTSKKNYSFKGRRTIGENKSNYSKYNSGSESDGSTTNDMMSILNSDTKSIKSNSLGMNQMAMSDINQMAMPAMNQMAMPGMNQMAMNQMAMPGMNQMAMPGMNQMAMSDINQMDINQMAMPGMNQMAMPGMNQMAMPGMNQMAMPGMNMMGKQPNINEIDNLMVNTLVPINNSSMNIDTTGYMNPSQMATNLGALAKLSNTSIPSNHMGVISNQQQPSNINLSNLAKLNM